MPDSRRQKKSIDLDFFRGDKKVAKYINKKGKEVELAITRHAYSQFIKRYKIIFPDKELRVEDVDVVLNDMFAKSNKVKNLNRCEKTRMKKYGKDTMYFRTNGLTFVVQNATIKTVEISDKDKRYLNKR